MYWASAAESLTQPAEQVVPSLSYSQYFSADWETFVYGTEWNQILPVITRQNWP